MKRTLPNLLLAALLALFVVPAAAGADADERLQRLQAAAERFPEDPDLAWALARALLEAERFEEAAGQLAGFEQRWPGLRPRVAYERGRALHAAGRDAQAVAALERAVAQEAAFAPAWFHLGLALRRLGRTEEAERALETAGRLEPELRGESLLLRALSRMETGDEKGAERLLRQVVELEPEGEAGLRARLLLPAGRDAARAPLLSAQLYGGYEFDTNVTLDSGTDLPGLTPDSRDERRLWGASVTARPVRGERLGLTLGLRYDQSDHVDLDRYDTRSELGFLSARWRTSERTTLRVDGLVSRSRLDDRRYARSRLLRPNLLVVLGDRLGVLRLSAEAEQFSIIEEPLLPSLERDGHALGGGVEHLLALPGWQGSWLALGVDFRRVEHDARRDLLGFASAYDHDRWRGTLRGRLPLWWNFSLESSLVLARERYAHRNVIDFLTDGGVGTADPRARRDTIAEATLTLMRPLTRHARAELAWRGTRRVSNVDVYDYRRRVVGLYLRLETP